MANNERGELALTVGDRELTLVLDMDAICQIESRMSAEEGRTVPFGECLIGAASNSYRHVRAVLWGALRHHHPNVTVNDAGDLLVEIGGPEAFFATLAKLRKASEPEGDRRPRRARQGRRTGARTSSTPNGSASVRASSGG